MYPHEDSRLMSPSDVVRIFVSECSLVPLVFGDGAITPPGGQITSLCCCCLAFKE